MCRLRLVDYQWLNQSAIAPNNGLRSSRRLSATLPNRQSMWLTVLLGGLAHAGTVTYVYTAPQGTPLAEADASGNITATFDYAPYGSQALGTPPDGPGYTGHVNDPESGLVYMQARYYDPAVGRFVSTDPVGPGVGNVFNFNRFAYANNNPVVNMDPDGRCTGTLLCGNGEGVGGVGNVTSGFVDPSEDGGGSSSHSSAKGTSAAPTGTPESMKQYFVLKDPSSETKAAVAVMDYFGIDHAGVTCCGILPPYSNAYAKMEPTGQLDIDRSLFRVRSV